MSPARATRERIATRERSSDMSIRSERCEVMQSKWRNREEYSLILWNFVYLCFQDGKQTKVFAHLLLECTTETLDAPEQQFAIRSSYNIGMSRADLHMCCKMKDEQGKQPEPMGQTYVTINETSLQTCAMRPRFFSRFFWSSSLRRKS